MVRFSKKSIFDIHNTKCIKRLYQLRVAHHKMRNGFRDTPTDICRCLRSPETTEHYLIHCDLYTEPRINLESHGLNLHGDLLINLLLYGNNTLSYDENKAILTATLIFILKSTRFETAEWKINGFSAIFHGLVAPIPPLTLYVCAPAGSRCNIPPLVWVLWRVFLLSPL